MKSLMTFLMLFCVGFIVAQQERTLTYNEDTDLIEVVYYHDNGEVSQKGFYTTEGKLHGEWYSYCEEGEKIVEGFYVDGLKEGKWVFWNGDYPKEVIYKNSKIVSVKDLNGSEIVYQQ